MTEHPRLNNLIRLPESGGHNADGVFDGDLRDIAIIERHKELGAVLSVLCPGRKPFAKFRPHPSVCRNRQKRAWRMPDHQIPSLIQDRDAIPLNMVSRLLAWHEIATPRIMPSLGKGIANGGAEFARNKDFHRGAIIALNSSLAI